MFISTQAQQLAWYALLTIQSNNLGPEEKLQNMQKTSGLCTKQHVPYRYICQINTHLLP